MISGDGREQGVTVTRLSTSVLGMILVAVAAVCSVMLTASPALAAGRRAVVPEGAVVAPARGSHAVAPSEFSSSSRKTQASVSTSMSPFAEPFVAGAGSTIPACNPIPPASQSSCDLTYNDGPVMLTNTTHIVFWAPSGYSYPSAYQALIERYLTDVAAAQRRPDQHQLGLHPVLRPGRRDHEQHPVQLHLRGRVNGYRLLSNGDLHLREPRSQRDGLPDRDTGTR